MKKISVLIVTFNRKEYLLKLLPNVLAQTYKVENILIFDNCSTDGTAETLKENGYISSVEVNKITSILVKNTIIQYYCNSENTGGSGGFHDGLELLRDQNFDYIWAMDDDVLPEPTCLEELMSTVSKDVRLVIPSRNDERYEDKAVTGLDLSNPFHYRYNRKKYIPASEIRERSISVIDMPFEGPLIDVSLIKEIGLPKKELFILYDDSEFAYRASKVTDLRFVTTAILHKQIIPVTDRNRMMNWKNYYDYRNLYWFDGTYGKNIFVRNLRPIFNHIDLLARAIILRKWSNIKVLNRAFRDGTHKILGKTVNPGEKF